MTQGANPEHAEVAQGDPAERAEVDADQHGEIEIAERAVPADDSLMTDIMIGPGADAFVAELNSDIVARFEAVLEDMEASSDFGPEVADPRCAAVQ